MEVLKRGLKSRDFSVKVECKNCEAKLLVERCDLFYNKERSNSCLFFRCCECWRVQKLDWKPIPEDILESFNKEED